LKTIFLVAKTYLYIGSLVR